MICKYCGKEIVNGAKFCNYCGKRTDGKTKCPSCGELLPDESLFCSACGERLNSAPVAESEVAAAEAVASQPVASSQTLGWKKIVTYISWGCIGFAALMGLIFTFCIGVAMNFSELNVSVSLYDYFGKAYEDCEHLVNTVLTDAELITKIEAYVPAVMGTVISACALICVVVFSIMTSVSCVNRFAHNKAEADWTKPATGLYVSFAVFATAFLALNACNAESAINNGMGAVVNTSVQLNGATKAGLILGGIGLGGYFVCKTALRIADFKDGKTIVKSSVMLGVGVVAIIVASLAAMPVLEMSQNSTSVGSGYMQLIGLLFTIPTENDLAVLCCGIVGFVVQVLLIAFTVKAVVASARYISEGDGVKVLPYTVTNVVLSAANLILAIISGNLYVNGLEGAEECNLGFGAPIAVFVLSVAALVASIVAVSLFRVNLQPTYEEAEVLEETEEVE